MLLKINYVYIHVIHRHTLFLFIHINFYIYSERENASNFRFIHQKPKDIQIKSQTSVLAFLKLCHNTWLHTLQTREKCLILNRYIRYKIQHISCFAAIENSNENKRQLRKHPIYYGLSINHVTFQEWGGNPQSVAQWDNGSGIG